MSKRYFMIVTAIYAVAVLVGLAAFRSPGLSRPYLQKYGMEHERYLAIFKSPQFKAYEERPALYPPKGRFAEDVEFVERYRARPEFIREEHRIAWYVEYFKVLNSAAFILYLAGLVGKPLLSFLDAQIEEIRRRFAEAEKARRAAAAQRAAAQAKVDEWGETEERIRKESEAAIAKHLAKIQEEADCAKALLEKQKVDRKQAELYTAARSIKTELVTKAIRQLEERYETELTQEKLNANVDRFIALMERLS